MNSESIPSSSAVIVPIYGDDAEACYTLDFVSAQSGVDSRTILCYQRQGFLRSAAAPDSTRFDLDALRRLRRIEHLRVTCAVNETGLALILHLLDELETLREERREASR